MALLLQSMPLSPAVRRQSMAMPLRLNISSSMASSRTCSPLSTLCSPSPLIPSCKWFFVLPWRAAKSTLAPPKKYHTRTKKWTYSNGYSKLSPKITTSQFGPCSVYATISKFPGSVQTPEPSPALERSPRSSRIRALSRSSQPPTHESPLFNSPYAVEPIPCISHHKSRGHQATDQGPEDGRGSGRIKG